MVNRIITNLAAFDIATTSTDPDKTGKDDGSTPVLVLTSLAHGTTVEDIQASAGPAFTVHLDTNTSGFELAVEGVPA